MGLTTARTFAPRPGDTLVEFGKVIGFLRKGDEALVRQKVLANFEATRKRVFPNWRGQPEIVVAVDNIKFRAIGWHALVPKKYVR